MISINTSKKFNILFIILFIYLIFLILKIYSFDYSYYDLGLYVDSFKSNNISKRFIFLGILNNLIKINNYFNLGLFLIFFQFSSLVVTTYILFRKFNFFVSLVYLLNANTVYVLFFDFHFEFLCVNFILIILLTQNNFVRYIAIFLLIIIKDIYVFLSLGFIIYYFKDNKKISYIFLTIIFIFLIVNYEYVNVIIEGYKNSNLLSDKLFNFTIVLVPIMIITKNFIFSFNKLFFIFLPYLFFLIFSPMPNLLNINYHYIHPFIFLIFFIYFIEYNIDKFNKLFFIIYILTNFIISPFSFLHVFLNNDYNLKETFEVGNSKFKQIVEDNLKVNDLLYIQNNFYSPLIASYSLKTLPLDSSKINLKSYMIINLNKNIFLEDKLIFKKDFSIDSYLNEFNYSVIANNKNIYLIYIDTLKSATSYPYLNKPIFY